MTVYLEIGKAIGKLYILDAESFDDKTLKRHEKKAIVNVVIHRNRNTEKSAISFDLWYCRMGNPFNDVIEHLGIKRMNKTDLIPCDVCCKAKQQCSPFPISANRSSKAFDLVHIDLWVPYHQKVMSGASFVLRIVDDNARGLWTYLLKHKIEVHETIQSFVNMVDT